MAIELTVRDSETGDTNTRTNGPTGWVLTCGPGCYLAHETRYSNGTVVLIIKPTRGGSDGE